MIAFEDYRSRDATALAAGIGAGEFTAEELLDCAIARAEAVNGEINAIVRWFIRDARERAGNPQHGPFTGVPFLLKDILQDVAGQPTTRGSRALPKTPAAVDSSFVRLAHAAGLNSFGQTNAPELGLKAITEPLAFGPTRNPWHTAHTPGGSSGGAAAAIAAGIVPMAGANDGGGSIRIPATYCGLFGLKPSRGRVSAGPSRGEVWEGAAVDHVISRSVRDSAAMLDVLSTGDTGDPFLIAPPDQPFSSAVGTNPGKLRIAVDTESPLGRAVHPDCVTAVTQTVRHLEDLGHHVEQARPAVDGIALARCYFMLYFGQTAATVTSADTSRFELETRLLAMIGQTISAGEYAAARQEWNAFSRALGRFFGSFDLYLTPATAQPPARIGELELPPWQQQLLRLALRMPGRSLLARGRLLERLALEQLERTPFTQLANLAGTPAMSVPLFRNAAGMPLGSHFTAPFGREERLFALAAQLERQAPWFNDVPAIRPDTADSDMPE